VLRPFGGVRLVFALGIAASVLCSVSRANPCPDCKGVVDSTTVTQVVKFMSATDPWVLDTNLVWVCHAIVSRERVTTKTYTCYPLGAGIPTQEFLGIGGTVCRSIVALSALPDTVVRVGMWCHAGDDPNEFLPPTEPPGLEYAGTIERGNAA